ncbi:hypothetical protein [Micromonospora sp. NBC_01813]|uniref:hypothetical protein n=1 Tax=Micromonospora sp. NBC_01813 TaxID=2975988 RepID=UPI002DD9CF30|nr:hypothetical protein [Micromonospora sp. NBC_01813]WSA06270.1 hypothetical protein OG958_18255 [Micromonospora sp. NBC_01813]
MQMYTDDMSVAMNALAAAGKIEGRWKNQYDVILGLESQLGNGPLGRAFAADYNPSAEQIVGSADSLVAAPEQMAQNGRDCVQTYLTAEDRNTQTFESA